VNGVTSTRYRVTFITPTFYPTLGGIETHVAQLAEHLTAAGHDVVVLTAASRSVISDHGRAEERDGYGIERYQLPVAATAELPPVGLLWAVGKHARDGRIIHAHNYHALTFLGAAARTRGSRLVLTPHYHGVGRTALRTAAHTLYRPAGGWALRRAAVVLALTGAEAEHLRRDFGPAVAAQVRVIPNGARVRPGTRKKLSRPTVFTWGRLQDYKRVDLLVQAAAQLPGADLLVAGDGPVRAALEELASGLGVTDRVRFLGRISDEELGDWLASDVLVAAASTIEAFGLTVADALASGRSVVASPVEAHRSVAALAGSGSDITFLPRSAAAAQHDPAGLASEVAAVLGTALDRLGTRSAGPVGSAATLPTWPMVTAQVAAVYSTLPRWTDLDDRS
jgi:glycosyltransferase involved in cell wall biosynthesis